MRRVLVSLILVLSFVIIPTCGIAEAQSCTLTINMPMGNENGNAAFHKLYPQIAIDRIDALTKEDIFTFVLTQSSDVDMFGSNTYNQPTYRELISREFYAPINSAKLRAFAENCYPSVKEVLFVENHLVGIPVWCLQAYQFGVEKSMWKELGLDDSQLPKTWLDVIDFIKNQWPALSSAHPDWCVINSNDYWLLFYEMLDDYSVYRRQASTDPGYDTDIFRDTMNAYLSIDPEVLPDDENKALFSAELQISPETPDIYRNVHYDYIPVGYTEGDNSKALLTLGLMVINPYSENKELCEAYLECLVDNIDPVQRAILQMNYTTPVLTYGWDEFFEDYTQTVDLYQNKIASVQDSAEKKSLQLELDTYIGQCSDLFNNKWLISEDSLQKYRQCVKDQVIMWDDALNEREVQLFDELCGKVFERTIPVDAIIDRLNRLYYFKALEDS